MKAEPRALLGGFPKGKRPGSTGVGRALAPEASEADLPQLRTDFNAI
jgi:hypothetical protein